MKRGPKKGRIQCSGLAYNMFHNLYIEYPPYDLGRYRIWIISKMKRQILVNLVYNNRVWSGMKSKISFLLFWSSF